ncbi:MAG: dTMP kinase [Candidatus Omnitrophota bacterium]
MTKGKFITFEGPEGAGKSTQVNLLVKFLKSKGLKVIHLREPGGVIISEKIRHILLDPKLKKMTPLTETLLYMAARNQLIEEKLKYYLNKNYVVICDRFIDATMVYQGYAGGVDAGLIGILSKYVVGKFMPDLTILLDIDTEIGLKRAGNIKDRIEQKPCKFHEKVRVGYLKLARKFPKRIKIIKTDKNPLLVQTLIREIVKNKLKIR